MSQRPTASTAMVRASLPAFTPQVGYTRLATLNTAELGQARVPVRSIRVARCLLAKRMDAWVKPGHDGQSERCSCVIIAGFSPFVAKAGSRRAGQIGRAHV